MAPKYFSSIISVKMSAVDQLNIVIDILEIDGDAVTLLIGTLVI